MLSISIKMQTDNTPPKEPSFKVVLLNEFLRDKVGINTPIDIPMLDIGCRRGGTDYIDFVKVSDMSDRLMWGYDIHKRFFLSVRYRVNDGDMKVTTVFQRYSDDDRTFVNGTAYLGRELFPSALMTDTYWSLLRDIIVTGSCTRDGNTFKCE
jgi:hypothetical protein